MRYISWALCFAISLVAQPTVSRLEGTVEDPSGRAVLGARIQAQNQQNGYHVTVFSDSQGFYVFLSLPPGRYSVTTEATGFRGVEVAGLVLNAGSTVTAPVRLEV